MTGATRFNTFKLKRSNVSGKIPTTSQLLIGELAVNTQDAFLYTAIADTGGTSTIDVKQIGWDRLSNLSGGTVHGNVTITGYLSATTYYNVPDAYVTGFTYSSNTITISQNQGKPDLTVIVPTLELANIFSAVTFNIGTTGSISATTFYGDGSKLTGIPDYYVTGGTYSNGTLTLNRGNGSVTVSGFYTGSTDQDTYVTGFTYNDNNKLTISQQGEPDLNVFLNVFSGLTVNGLINNLTAIRFNTTGVTIHTEGQIHWSDSDKTLELDTDVTDVKIQLGQENVVRVVNKTGSDIPNGTVVFINGAQGNRPTVTLADYRTESASTRTIGIATHNITDNNNGWVTTFGLVRDIDTSSHPEGTELYLFTGGTYTSTRPIAPLHVVRVGFVIVSDITSGIILTTVADGYNLNRLSDVYYSGVTNNQLLAYSSSNQRFENTSNIVVDSISAATYQNLPIDPDNYVTGGTYSNGTLTLSRQNGSVTVNGFFTGGTDTYVTGVTFSDITRVLTVSQNAGQPDLTTTIPDYYVTGGTYSNGTLTLNRGNGLVTVSGFYTGTTDQNTYVTGFTYNNANKLTISQNGGQPDLSVNINIMTGLTVNGSISATTYLGLPIDPDNYVTGGTYSNGTLTLNRQNGSVTISGFYTGSTDQDSYVTGFTYSNNNIVVTQNGVGPTLSVNISTMTGLTISGNLTVTGNTDVKSLFATSAVISSTTQNILTIYGSGSTQPIVSVQGSQGQLFSVSDTMTGSLFSVNNISGLPILEVFSNDTVLMGNNQSPSLNSTIKVTANSGTTIIYSIPSSAYTGAWFDYTVNNSLNARAGTIMTIWSGSTVKYTETSTTDIGDTSLMSFDVSISGGLTSLRAITTTDGWTVKTIVRSI